MKNRSSKRTLTKCAEIDDVVAPVKRYSMAREALRNHKKQPMKVKKFAIYLMERFSSLTNNKISKGFDITYSAASKAAGNNEKLIKQRQMCKEGDQRINFTIQV